MADQYLDITSAGAQIRCTVIPLYPSGFTVTEFSAENMVETEAVTLKETVMGADGKFHAGVIFNPIQITLNLNAGSPSIDNFINVATTELTTKSVMSVNMIISYPSRKVEYTLVNGFITESQLLIPAARILSDVTVTMQFQSISVKAL